MPARGSEINSEPVALLVLNGESFSYVMADEEGRKSSPAPVSSEPQSEAFFIANSGTSILKIKLPCVELLVLTQQEGAPFAFQEARKS